jgi:hypothetical protein
MPGLTLGIGETNPKRGAVQYDARRIDGVPFVIPSGAGVSSAPIGSIVTLQEYNSKQVIVLGAKALTIGSSTYAIIGLGFLEAATQTDNRVDQSVGVLVDGDIAAMVSSIDVVASVPAEASTAAPNVGRGNFITVNGTLTNTSSSNVVFPGVCFYGTPGVQSSGQLKTGYCFARLATVTLAAALS